MGSLSPVRHSHCCLKTSPLQLSELLGPTRWGLGQVSHPNNADMTCGAGVLLLPGRDRRGAPRTPRTLCYLSAFNEVQLGSSENDYHTGRIDLLRNTHLWHHCLWSPIPGSWPAWGASLAEGGAGEVEPATQEPVDSETWKGNPISPSQTESRCGEDCLLWASDSPPEFRGLF